MTGVYDISRITTDARAQFHLLRHLHELDAASLQSIQDAGYDEKQIQLELQLPGSRFYQDFATGTVSLLSQFKNVSLAPVRGENGNIILSHIFDSDVFPHGIGTLSVIPLPDVPPDLHHQLYKKENRGIELWHLPVNKFPVTQVCTLILRPGDFKDYFITAFPGPAAMPLPDPGMPPDFFSRCSTFWENHVFLEATGNIESTGI